jgi:hypothetical protein
MAPKNAYFELLAHPDNNIAYILIDDTANKYNTPIFISAITPPSLYGITAQLIKANVNPITGAIMYIPKFECDGNIVSFVNNFTPSANGCNNPHHPTTFGPFLNCIDPNTFLSANVT